MEKAMEKAMEKWKHFLKKKNYTVFFRRLFLAAFVVGCIVLEFSFPSFAAPSWIRSGESEVYQNIERQEITLTEDEEIEEDSIMKHMDNLFSHTKKGAQDLLHPDSQFDLSLNGIILGRAGGYDISIAKFELYKNNPYGIIGAIGFVILRNLVYGLLVIYFLWGLVKNSIHSGVNNRRELKEDIYSALVIIGILYFVPVVINWITVARDSLTFRMAENMIGTVDGTAGGLVAINDIIQVFYEDQGFNLILGMIHLAYTFAGWFYVANYVLVALQSMGLFICLPWAVLKSFKDKRYLEGWLMKLFANQIIPLIDYILLLTPVWIRMAYENAGISTGGLGERTVLAIITVLIIWSVIPARNYIMAALGNGGVGARAGGFGMAALMAMRMLTGNKGSGGGKSSGNGQSVGSDLTNAERFEAMSKDFNQSLSQMDSGKTWKEFKGLEEMKDADAQFQVRDLMQDASAKGDADSISSLTTEDDAFTKIMENNAGERNYIKENDILEEFDSPENTSAELFNQPDQVINELEQTTDVDTTGGMDVDTIGGMAEEVDNKYAPLDAAYDNEYQTVESLDPSLDQVEQALHEQQQQSLLQQQMDPMEEVANTGESIEGFQNNLDEEALENTQPQNINSNADSMNEADLDDIKMNKDDLDDIKMNKDELLDRAPESYEDAFYDQSYDEISGKTFNKMSQGQQLDYLREQNLSRIDGLKEWQRENAVPINQAKQRMESLSEETAKANRQKQFKNNEIIGQNEVMISGLQKDCTTLREQMANEYGGITHSSQLGDSVERAAFESKQADLHSKETQIQSLHDYNTELRKDNARLEERGTTYDADKYQAAKKEYDQMVNKSTRVQQELEARQEREKVFTQKSEVYTGDGRTFESADAFREVRVNRERLRKQANFRNFDSSPAGNLLSPDEKAHYARVRAATNVAGTAAKAVVGTLGAGAMMAGGSSAMIGGAMMGAMAVDVAGNMAMGTADYLQARNDNRNSGTKEKEEEATAVSGLEFTDTSVEDKQVQSTTVPEKKKNEPSDIAKQVAKIQGAEHKERMAQKKNLQSEEVIK